MELCVSMTERAVDERTIAACREGDREAFRRLYDAHQSQVYSTALYFMHGDSATAEDITQEVFLKLFFRIGQFRSESGFSTWLHRLVVNCCLDELRRRERFVADSLECDGASRDLTGDPLQFETANEVKLAVASLSPKLRITVLLKHFQDLSYEEIARTLGCSTGTVASRLNRGHKILARKLAHLKDALISGG